MSTINEYNQRIMDTNPFETIDQQIEKMIDKAILTLNPLTLDDDVEEVLNDFDNRSEAIDYIMDKLIKMREE